jgi:uncharacterized protein YozE (UPF0346 family)
LQKVDKEKVSPALSANALYPISLMDFDEIWKKLSQLLMRKIDFVCHRLSQNISD